MWLGLDKLTACWLEVCWFELMGRGVDESG
jgi:hypothetical protein